MKSIFALLLLAVFCLTAGAQMTEKQWQAKAVEKYPALGVQGSELNKRFIEAYTIRQKSNPHFFTSPQWPLTLADELAATAPLDPPPPRPFEPPRPIEAT